MHDNLEFIGEAFDEHAIVSMTDAAGNITYVNQKFIDISGYSRQELLGKNHRMLKSGIHPRPFYEQMWDTLLDGKTWHGEICNRRRNGEFYWVRASIKPLLDSDNLPLKYISIRADITEFKLAEEAEHRSRMLLRSVIDTIPDLIFFKDKNRVYLGCNRAFEQYLGVPEEQIIGKTDLDFTHRNIAFFLEMDQRMLATGQAQTSEELLSYPDGRKVWWEVLKTPYHYGDDAPGVIGVAHDITERKNLQSAMKRHEQVIETAMDGFWMINTEGILEEVNEAYARMSGYTMQELVGMHISKLEANERPDEVSAHIAKAITQGSDRFETKHRCRDGRIIDIEISSTFMPESQKFFVFGHDITQRKRAEDEIRNLAFCDPLTRLPNRRLFIDRLNAALPASERHRNYGALMFIDMDRFKQLNDTLGHECGDLMLIEVAKRIKCCVREMDTVARLGGDEFVVLIEAVSGDEQDALSKVGKVAEKIRVILTHPYHLLEHLHHSSPSIGVTLYQGNEVTVDTLLRRADLAMYQVKNSGRNAVCFFDPSMQQTSALT